MVKRLTKTGISSHVLWSRRSCITAGVVSFVVPQAHAVHLSVRELRPCIVQSFLEGYSYIQKLVQTKWDVAVHGRDLYLVKPTLGPPKKFQHLTRAEEVVITRLRIGHTKATKSHILSRRPPTGCHHCGQTLTIDHMLLECALLRECRDEYYTVDSLNALFETIPETCIVEFLQEAGFFYLI